MDAPRRRAGRDSMRGRGGGAGCLQGLASAGGRLARRVPFLRRPFIANDRLVLALDSLNHDLEVCLERAIDKDREISIKDREISTKDREISTKDREIGAQKSRVAALEDQLAQQRSLEVLAGRLSLLAGNVAGLATRQDESMRSLHRLLAGAGTGGAVRELYLELLEAALTGMLWEDEAFDPWGDGTYEPAKRSIGRDWPASALTMIGTARMKSLRALVEQALEEGVPGDLVETGVWRGGACIYMRGILAAAGDTTRRVFVADSFRGLPEPDSSRYPEDEGSILHTHEGLAVPRAAVEENFRRFGLLDDQVAFLEGWFKDTLPSAPIDRLAILRLDGDMYESTTDALEALYGKVSPGGFVIIDDYNLWPCTRAVDDFRARHSITEPLHDIDGAGVWWRLE